MLVPECLRITKRAGEDEIAPDPAPSDLLTFHPMRRPEASEGLKLLLQEQGGLFRSTSSLLPNEDEPQIISVSAELGDVGSIWPEVAKRIRGNSQIGAYGCGLDFASALIPSLAEGWNQYSTAVYHNEQFVYATGEELGAEGAGSGHSSRDAVSRKLAIPSVH